MIEAKSLKKAYGNLQVLNGINLKVEKAEIVSIVGKSGAGKSTLLHILGMLDTFDNGELIINDTPIHKLKNNDLPKFRNENIGFVFQFHHLLPEFTALENICIPAFIAKKSKADAEKKAIDLLKLLELENRKDHKPNQLSGGEQQRIAVARALINNPKIIFADEPSGNLDTNTSKMLHQLFFNLRAEIEQTFIIVTHNEELANMADRKLVINDGVVL